MLEGIYVGKFLTGVRNLLKLVKRPQYDEAYGGQSESETCLHWK